MNLTGSLGLSNLSHRAEFVPIEPLSNVSALPATDKGARCIYRGDGAGAPMLVIYARFIAWSIEQSRFPMPEQVVDRFHCSRATAHRWLNCLAEAYGVDRPKRGRDGLIREIQDEAA